MSLQRPKLIRYQRSDFLCPLIDPKKQRTIFRISKTAIKGLIKWGQAPSRQTELIESWLWLARQSQRKYLLRNDVILRRIFRPQQTTNCPDSVLILLTAGSGDTEVSNDFIPGISVPGAGSVSSWPPHIFTILTWQSRDCVERERQLDTDNK